MHNAIFFVVDGEDVLMREHENESKLRSLDLVRVTLRISFVPSPGAFDDFVHARELRYPAEFLANLVAGRNKHSGIAGTPRPDICVDRSTRYFACSIDDLLDREAFTIA